MMSLSQQIDQDLKQAMMDKNEVKLSTLRMLKSALKYSAIEKKLEALPDAEACQIIQKQIKQRRESIQQFSDGGRKELAAKEQLEVTVLEAYLPKQLSDEELKKIVEDETRKAQAFTKKDFGRMMKTLTEQLAGKADARRISEALGKILT